MHYVNSKSLIFRWLLTSLLWLTRALPGAPLAATTRDLIAVGKFHVERDYLTPNDGWPGSHTMPTMIDRVYLLLLITLLVTASEPFWINGGRCWTVEQYIMTSSMGFGGTGSCAPLGGGGAEKRSALMLMVMGCSVLRGTFLFLSSGWRWKLRCDRGMTNKLVFVTKPFVCS